MKLQGSCHCQAVRFSMEADEPCPFMLCYCSICRKTAGAGGFAINLGASNPTLQVEGKENLSVYRARLADGRESTAERNFCKRCGSALWVYDPSWPDLIHPHASAIDSPLPVPPAIDTEGLTLDRYAWSMRNRGERGSGRGGSNRRPREGRRHEVPDVQGSVALTHDDLGSWSRAMVLR